MQELDEKLEVSGGDYKLVKGTARGSEMSSDPLVAKKSDGEGDRQMEQQQAAS